MIVATGTKSTRKIQIIEKILRDYNPPAQLHVFGYDVDSGVSETPWNEETLIGANNRAHAAAKLHTHADLAIGLESGLVERYGTIYEEAWAVILNKNQEYTGYSSGLKVPDYVIQKMKLEKIEHFEVMMKLEKELHFDTNETWGNYSKNTIVREISLQEALRNAYIQIISPKDSLFHTK